MLWIYLNKAWTIALGPTLCVTPFYILVSQGQNDFLSLGIKMHFIFDAFKLKSNIWKCNTLHRSCNPETHLPLINLADFRVVKVWLREGLREALTGGVESLHFVFCCISGLFLDLRSASHTLWLLNASPLPCVMWHRFSVAKQKPSCLRSLL